MRLNIVKEWYNLIKTKIENIIYLINNIDKIVANEKNRLITN